jgi:hypothetical protein
MRLIALDPGKPQSKGQVERTNGYLERSFLSLRGPRDLEDLQARRVDRDRRLRAPPSTGRRLGRRRARRQRRFLHALPDPLPDVDARTEVRVHKDVDFGRCV